MKRGFLLYTPQDASQNTFLIERYRVAAKKLGVVVELCLDGFSPLLMKADFVINRSRNSDVARLLERAGVYVSNSSITCEVANNKLKTYTMLNKKVPMLPTLAANSADPYSMKYPIVVKPVDGHGGSGVTLINNPAALCRHLDAVDITRSIVQPLGATGRDLRVYVVGNRPVACMQRVSTTDFRSNYSLGGSAYYVSPFTLSCAENAIINAVCSALPLDYAGVDIIYSGSDENASPVLNEIEDPVGARMLYSNTDIDAAYLHMEYVISRLSH